jgi:hypothetical protein
MMSENDENNEYARACRGTREEIEGEISDMGDSPVDASTTLTSRRRRSVVRRRKCTRAFLAAVPIVRYWSGQVAENAVNELAFVPTQRRRMSGAHGIALASLMNLAVGTGKFVHINAAVRGGTGDNIRRRPGAVASLMSWTECSTKGRPQAWRPTGARVMVPLAALLRRWSSSTWMTPYAAQKTDSGDVGSSLSRPPARKTLSLTTLAGQK